MYLLSMRVNGRPVTVDAAPDAMLVDVLREQLHLTGSKVGCGTGECGACTVLLNGRPVASCITPAQKAQGADVLTIEGVVAPDGGLHPIQRAFLATGAVQCGFCTPGMILATKALLDESPDPTEAEIRAALEGHLCRCTGYTAIVEAVQTAARALQTGAKIPLDLGDEGPTLGRSVVRKDGPAKVTGAFDFGADQAAPGMLHAAAVFSEHPYADVLAIDVAPALALPGVAAVLTAQDVPGANMQGIIIPDQPVLVPAGERVRSVGDVLALVVAETEAQARAAAAQVRVEYRELQGVFSPAEALAPGAPVLHAPPPGREPSNVMYGTHIERGDPDAALAGADAVVTSTYRTPFAEHGYLEPEAGLATVDESGVVTVRMASQAVTIHRFMLAGILGLPPDRVRLVHVSPGGAFGARSDLTLHPYLALAAYKLGRPVKMVLTREESLRFHSKRHAMEHRVRLGARRDGRLVGLTCDILADTGAYSSAGIPVLDQASLFATGPYDIPNVRIKGLSVYTNNIACGAMRGFGIPQSGFAIESAMDELAERLGMDPFALRRLNGLRPGSTTATGQPLLASVPFLQTLDVAEQRLQASVAALPPPAAGHRRGAGVACCFKNVGLGLGLPEATSAEIHLMPDGRVRILAGGADLGQGSNSATAQIAAEALGLPYRLIDVVACDTGETPDGGITSASRTSYMTGNAILGAAGKFLAELRGLLPPETPLTPDTVQELAAEMHAAGRRLVAAYTYNPPATYGLDATGPDQQAKFAAFSYATQAAIVDVDTATGEVHVQKMIAVHDVGRAINPQGAAGQIAGSCVMGLGYALSEELVLDRGRLATKTLAAVGIPISTEAPPVEVVLVEDPEPSGPYGIKGIAEAATIPSAPAIINAVYAATGARIRELPATPDRVTAELRKTPGKEVELLVTTG